MSVSINRYYRTSIVAHRGASYSAPENTIPSFELAFMENADFIEGDFRLTLDNEIVCIHDPDTRRVSANRTNLNVQNSTLTELKKLDVGAWKGGRYKGETIPTLKEVLKLIPEGKGIFIEIKDDREIFTDRLSAILKQFSIPTNKIRVIAFNKNTVLLARKYLPEIKTYWILEWYNSAINQLFSSPGRLTRQLHSINCDGIDLNAVLPLSGNFTKHFRENNIDFGAYNVETHKRTERLLLLGADFLTTNEPLRMRIEIEKYFEMVNEQK